jgi:mannose-6-phosphate isomerase
MKKLFRLKGQIQNYAWGGTNFIPHLLGNQETGGKCAEYWLGAHENAPSMVRVQNEPKLLNAFLRTNLHEILGSKIANKFGRLPFLFKVLDVNDMLSIQVHPTKKEAEKGYKRENEEGIPLDAPYRNYKDNNHKPEIMVALGEFWLLHGFLSEEKLKKVLEDNPEFQSLSAVFKEQGYKVLYKTVMEQSQETTNKTLQPLVDRIAPLYKSGKLEKSSPDYWAAKTVVSEPNTKQLDKGIYSIYFFNIVKVNKGEAVFQDAGIPHAYLEGQNMELMANSDNVLRGGLTPKHVDVPELLKHTKFEATIPNIMKGALLNDGLERIYKSPAPDFELSQISLDKTDEYKSTSKTAQILIVIEGEATIEENNTVIEIKKGESVFLVANAQYKIASNSNTTVYKATAP